MLAHLPVAYPGEAAPAPGGAPEILNDQGGTPPSLTRGVDTPITLAYTPTLGSRLIYFHGAAVKVSGRNFSVHDDAGNSWTPLTYQEDSDERWIAYATCTVTSVPTTVSMYYDSGGSAAFDNSLSLYAIYEINPPGTEIFDSYTADNGAPEAYIASSAGITAPEGVSLVNYYLRVGRALTFSEPDWAIDHTDPAGRGTIGHRVFSAATPDVQAAATSTNTVRYSAMILGYGA